MKHLTPRTRILILFGMVLVALILLSASLGTLQMREGHPVSDDYQPPSLESPEISSEWGRQAMLIFRILMIATWAGIPFLIIYLILSKDARRYFVQQLLTYLPIVFLLYMLSMMDRGRGEEGAPQIFSPGLMPTIEAASAPLPGYTPPPDWITTAVVIIIGLSVTLSIAGIAFILWRRSQIARNEPLQKVEQEARAALDAIQSGGDLRAAILHAYSQMIEAAHQYRNISRAEDMTPREFEQLLEQRGLPAGPIHQLTELFEQVRYGGQTPGRAQEHAAIDSLSAIISACQKTRRMA